MNTKLIKLKDGTLVEIEVLQNEAKPISNRTADQVETTLEKIRPTLVNVCRPIAAAWKEINQEMQIEQAEIVIGFSFEGEGNIYVTKAKAGANLAVKLVLKPKE
jgi:hypothetical protein